MQQFKKAEIARPLPDNRKARLATCAMILLFATVACGDIDNPVNSPETARGNCIIPDQDPTLEQIRDMTYKREIEWSRVHAQYLPEPSAAGFRSDMKRFEDYRSGAIKDAVWGPEVMAELGSVLDEAPPGGTINYLNRYCDFLAGSVNPDADRQVPPESIDFLRDISEYPNFSRDLGTVSREYFATSIRQGLDFCKNIASGNMPYPWPFEVEGKPGIVTISVETLCPHVDVN